MESLIKKKETVDKTGKYICKNIMNSFVWIILKHLANYENQNGVFSFSKKKKINGSLLSLL